MSFEKGKCPYCGSDAFYGVGFNPDHKNQFGLEQEPEESEAHLHWRIAQEFKRGNKVGDASEYFINQCMDCDGYSAHNEETGDQFELANSKNPKSPIID